MLPTITGIAPLPIALWWNWLKNVRSSLKWFVLILFTKPVLDAFYFVKNSGAFSPSQLLGVFVFFAAISYIIIKRKRQHYSIADFMLLIFGILLFLNATTVYLTQGGLKPIGDFLRILTPVVFYFYIRNEIDDLDDLNGILFTYVLSSVFPYLIFLYEFFLAPIKIVELSEGRGGGFRLTGIYSDMFNYMSYIIGDFIILMLYFSNRAYIGFKGHIIPVFATLMLTVMGLIGIKHQASWGVFLALLLLFFIFNVRMAFGRYILIGLLGISILFSKSIWKNAILPLYSKEINVYEGKSEENRALNGRVYRWKKYFAIWNHTDIVSHGFGIGFSGQKAAPTMMSGGMHSDYVRFLFSTGFMGLLAYLLFFISLIFMAFRHPLPIRMLILMCVTVFLLYAISSNPFGSSGALMYLGIIGLSLASKPKNFFVA